MDKISVLVIDSNVGFLQLLVRFLEEHASTIISIVSVATTPAAAVTAAAAHHPQIAILAINGTWFDGDLITALRAVRTRLCIIAIAQLDIQEYRTAALAAGATRFLSKDTLHRDLLPTVRELADDPACA